MPIPRFLVIVLLVLSTIPAASAQQSINEMPSGIEALRHGASSKTEFTLDHSMLILASKLDASNEDLVRVIAGVSGVSVHRYRFAEPWAYDTDALRSVKDGYHSAGWMQLVNKHDKDGLPGATDLWIRWQNDVISNIAILVARSEEVTFVEIVGSISPLDLSHLGGHFGIPKIEGGVRVPSQHR
jgi:Domain of unknown function (DUF4252)